MPDQQTFSLALHGGAGTITRDSLTPAMEQQYRTELQRALDQGYRILQSGGSALSAVEATVRQLEDCPLFNAGKGSVFSHAGQHEMDASIMCGKTLEAGAVTGVRNVRNPIALASHVLRHSDHVLLSHEGAQEFARLHGLALEEDRYFFTQQRYDQWQALKDSDAVQLDHTPQKKFGTVGAVALDLHGNLAAATSTGGMTNKQFNRIGDSPLIGAGTYANNQTCAVSCTGHGEFFMRYVVAYDVSCLMEYGGMDVAAATQYVVHQKLAPAGGEGGLIAISAKGEVAMPFNSEGMYRGYQLAGEAPHVYIYQD